MRALLKTLGKEMRITPRHYPVKFGNYNNNTNDYTPTLVRYNRLHDLEFDIIADKIRSENLKNQMSLKLSQLKKNINKFINKENI